MNGDKKYFYGLVLSTAQILDVFAGKLQTQLPHQHTQKGGGPITEKDGRLQQ